MQARLPEVFVPYAERLFVRFPEVLVSLGSPDLEENFDLPPVPGASVRLEETGSYKLLQIRLVRRSSAAVSGRRQRPRAALERRQGRAEKPEPSLSPFSRSRVLAGRQDGGAAAARERRLGSEIECCPAPQPPAAPPPAPLPGPPPGPAESKARVVDGAGGLTVSKALGRAALGQQPGRGDMLDPGSPRLARSGSHGQWCGSASAPQGEPPERRRPSAGSLPGRPAEAEAEQAARQPPEAVPEDSPGEPPQAPPEGPPPREPPRAAGELGEDGEGAKPLAKARAREALASQARTGRQRLLSAASEVLSPVLEQDDGAGRSACSQPSGVSDDARSAEQPQQQGDSQAELLWLPHGVVSGRQSAGSVATQTCPTTPSDNSSDVGEVHGPGQPRGRGLDLSEGAHRLTPKSDKMFRRPTLDFAQDWRRLSSDAQRPSGSGGRAGPQMRAPAVIVCKQTWDIPKHLLQPLPAAFPHERAVIFMDWDDTLCPTNAIRQVLKSHMLEEWDWATPIDGSFDFDWKDQVPPWFSQRIPDVPDLQEAISQLQSAVAETIRVAQTLGVVCIVTNAVDGWVPKTIQKWMPMVKPVVVGHGAQPPICVLYGQKMYRKPAPGSAAEALEWVDGLGELTWWKRDAMLHALECLDDLYRVNSTRAESPASWGSPPAAAAGGLPAAPASAGGPPTGAASSGRGRSRPRAPAPAVSWTADAAAGRVASIISIGDSEAEMQAGLLAMHTLGSQLGRKPRSLSAPSRDAQGEGHEQRAPWVKNVKLKEMPSVKDMVDQLRGLARLLPQIVGARAHLRLEPEDLRRADLPPDLPGALPPSLLRALRTQTV
ncbi:unnamed protein product [Prorocentrum cordatum]|uniref:Uncharacterized protein n=1 Tax=Prorocentrum cordatum TaxID=2364126 RepID=A0ABN9SNL2_9DINO|nr:unnamed protein product [Polarella glacialis]